MSRLTILEDLLNRRIGMTTPAKSLLKQLDGKCMLVRLKGTSLCLSFIAADEGLVIDTEQVSKPDTTISATPLGFMRLAKDADVSTAGSGDVHLEGDAECARLFQRLLDYGRPDWEEELSRLVGDVAAHQIGNVARGLKEFATNTVDTLSRNAAEFLREESGDVPNQTEVEEFLRDVDTLSADFDRLRQRMRKLETILDAAKTGSR